MTKLEHRPDNEIFQLTLDFDAPENQPLEMVCHDRRDRHGWTHNGPKVVGAQTRKFTWVYIGYCRTFDEVKQKLRRRGKTPEGQWCQAVKATFQHDAKYHRGIADASWSDSDGNIAFPRVDAFGEVSFPAMTDNDFSGDYRWLVEVLE